MPANFSLNPVARACSPLLLVGALALAMAPAAFAQKADGSDQERVAVVKGDNQNQENVLTETLVEAERVVEDAGVSRYSKQQLQSVPGGNGDIQGALVRHPGVQFDNDSISANTPGSIDPNKISIHGAKPYDTQVTVDGVSINSGISGGVSYETVDKKRVDADKYQTMAVDSKLLCGVTVYDSNVSAAYGKFSGGVVEGEVCAPTKNFSGDVSLEYTSSKWLEKKNFDDDGEIRNSTSADKYSDFTNWTYRGSFESKVNDRLGLVGSFSKKTSDIPLRAYEKGYEPVGDSVIKNNKTTISNYYLKGFYTHSDSSSWEFSLMSNPVAIFGFNANTKNGGYESKAGGLLANLTFKHRFDNGLMWKQQLSFKENESSRYADGQDRFYWKNLGDKNWGGNVSNRFSAEGGYGDIEQEERVLSYKFDFNFPEKTIGTATHRVSLGGNLEQDEYTYSRLTEGYDYNFATAPSYGGDCVKSDGTLDSACAPATAAGNDGQFATFRTPMLAGTIGHKSNYKALYLEDAIAWDRLKIRGGLRWESYSDAKDAVWAPRLMSSYEFADDRSVKLELGANRYYAQNLKSYFILGQKRALTDGGNQRRTSINSPWVQGAPTWAMLPPPDGLKQPYADEYALALSKIYNGFRFQAKYVHRKGKDEVALKREGSGATQNYYPANLGSSQADNYYLQVDSIKPIEFSGTKTMLSAAFDYSKKKRSSNDWNISNDLFDGQDFKYAIYQGNLIRTSELPVQNYHRPWTLRLMSSTEFEKQNIRLDGILRIRKGYEKVDAVDTTTVAEVPGKVNIYDKFQIGTAFNFDIKLTKKWNIRKNEGVYAELSVVNLFNNSNEYGYSASSDQYLFEKGRQATVRVGYEF